MSLIDEALKKARQEADKEEARAAEALRKARAEGSALYPLGGRTMLGLGLPPGRAGDSEPDRLRARLATGDFQVGDGRFSFAVPFPDGPGIYTVVVWVRPHGSSGDAIPASDVSIRVDASAAGTMMAGTR